MTLLYRLAWHAACFFGRPIGGIRPRRIYHWLSQRIDFDPTLRPVRSRWGYRLNLSPHYYIDRSVIAFGAYDMALHKHLDGFLKPGMVCCDIGANIGEVTLHLAKLVGPGGAVYAFEPAPAPLRRLRDNITLNDAGKIVTVFPIALSDAEDTAEFAFADELTQNQGMGSLTSRVDGVASNLTQVRTRRFDDVVAELNPSRLDLLKIDIQGAEIMMLRGAEATLLRFKPRILMEISPDDLAAINLTSRDLLQHLDRLGYDVFRMAGGATGDKIDAATVDPKFYADNVVCVARGERP